MSSKSQALLVALTWMVMLVQTGLAQLPPPPSQPDSVLGIPGLFPPGTPKEVLQCWSSLTDTRGCVVAIFSSILSLNFGNIGQACCESFVKISSDCWPKMFPLNPLFAPLLNSTCAALIGKSLLLCSSPCQKKKTRLLCSSLIAATCTAMVFQLGQTQLPLLTSIGLIPGLPQLVNLGDITKRLSSVKDIQGCLMGLHTSVSTVQFADTIGSACSKAFLAIDGYCMSKLFTLNPLFPPLLKSYCSI
ncbi:uncharacterized protein LOC112490084 [Ziziphus jujuba]|uniref:Uncharacterized protein LOC112490084 n=1 Tax=Ziziphus jujuba TaxID=326968 RepID=A0ABM3ZYC5_ZIZJJ|nr:uncharacterized protein LOC112490084 [Ziziphus jujuba]